jgi:exopolysaccharide biosynthesis polyprenyl glycosylphosphotransferase
MRAPTSGGDRHETVATPGEYLPGDALAPKRGADRRWRARSRRLSQPLELTRNADLSPVWEITGRAGSHNAGLRDSWRRDAGLRRALALTDVVAAYASLLVAAFAVPGASVALGPAILLLAPLVVGVSKALGLYDRDQYVVRHTTIDEIPSILQLSTFVVLFVWLTEDVLLTGSLTRLQVFAMLATHVTVLLVGRSVARSALRVLTAPERCLVVGPADAARRTATKLAGSPGVKVTVVGYLSPSEEAPGSAAPLTGPGGFRQLTEMIDDLAVERVIIVPDGHDQQEVIDGIRLIKALGVKVSVVPRLLEVVGSAAVYDDVDGITLLGVRQYGLSNSSAVLKRTMDICGALLGLVILAPVMAVLAVAVRWGSQGPALFRQMRIGRRGKRFEMLKFRTMIVDAEQIKDRLREHNEAVGGLFKMSDDPRITSIGRFLRRTSLDELPQLFNVLRGDMSLVGPRPLVLDEDALIEGWQRRRLTVKPGMTGLWQIFGSSRIPMAEMVKIDYMYGANWSLWLDLKVLLRTLPYMLGRRGQ